MSVLVSAIITDVLNRLNVLLPGVAPSSAQADLCLGVVNQILDDWNAERRASYAEIFTDYTITPNLQPHTIGPTGTFVVTARPVTIEAIDLILNISTPNVFTPITQHDSAWWMQRSVPALATSFPTEFYYQSDLPNGSIYFWPVPTIAYGLRIQARTQSAAVTLSTALTLAQGYRSALTWTLMEEVSEMFGRAVSDSTRNKAAEARGRIFANNTVVPLIITRAAGMMPRPSGRTSFNYRSRSFT